MNEEYFKGSLGQLIERARLLLARVPRQTAREFRPLAQTCNDRLAGVIRKLTALRDGEKYRAVTAQRERLDLYRSAVELLDLIETVAIAALERQHQDEVFLNRVLDEMTHEIGYPLVPPAVSSLSRDYFHIYTQFNLICVPLAESRHLLHWADLYHELAHAVLAETNHPAVAPFKQAISEAFARVQQHFLTEQQRLDLTPHPQLMRDNLVVWLTCWESWLDEFFCDLFAVFALGPAYVWSHLHLCAQQKQVLFEVPKFEITRHPVNGARMQLLLQAVDQLGFGQESMALRERWADLMNVTRETSSAAYDHCYPRGLFDRMVDLSFEGYKQMGCTLASSQLSGVRGLLTDAWSKFWTDPAGYPQWETKAVESLRA